MRDIEREERERSGINAGAGGGGGRNDWDGFAEGGGSSWPPGVTPVLEELPKWSLLAKVLEEIEVEISVQATVDLSESSFIFLPRSLVWDEIRPDASRSRVELTFFLHSPFTRSISHLRIQHRPRHGQRRPNLLSTSGIPLLSRTFPRRRRRSWTNDDGTTAEDVFLVEGRTWGYVEESQRLKG